LAEPIVALFQALKQKQKLKLKLKLKLKKQQTVLTVCSSLNPNASNESGDLKMKAIGIRTRDLFWAFL
jgi:uncharacterized protein YunC (DUF1805 family)